jgi:hypothetical protein
MDLVRDILLAVEESTHAAGWCDVNVQGHSTAEVTYHVRMLHEQGLIEAQDLSSLDGACWKPKRLTWQGHEFLESARSEKVWKMAKEKVVSATGTLTLEAMKVALGQVLKGLLTGIVN